jgi:hypothetical protein
MRKIIEGAVDVRRAAGDRHGEYFFNITSTTSEVAPLVMADYAPDIDRLVTASWRKAAEAGK